MRASAGGRIRATRCRVRTSSASACRSARSSAGRFPRSENERKAVLILPLWFLTDASATLTRVKYELTAARRSLDWEWPAPQPARTRTATATRPLRMVRTLLLQELDGRHAVVCVDEQQLHEALPGREPKRARPAPVPEALLRERRAHDERLERARG